MYSGLAQVKSEGPGCFTVKPDHVFGGKSQTHLHMRQKAASLNVCDAN